MIKARFKTQRLPLLANGFTFCMLFLAFAMLALPVGYPTVLDGGPYLPRITHPIFLWSGTRGNICEVTISRNGRMYFGNERVESPQLPALIRQKVASGAEPKLYLWADAYARWSSISEVVDAAREAGVTDLAFRAEWDPTVIRARH